MMRHSKSQTTLDGRSILSLPPKTIHYVPVQLKDSELASYAFLEQLIVRESAWTGAPSNPRPSEKPNESTSPSMASIHDTW